MLGETTATVVDADGNPQTVTSPMGEVTTMTYTARDQMLTRQLPADPVPTSYRYDAAGGLSSTTDPNGNVNLTTYDPAGRPAQHLKTRGPWPTANPPGGCRASTVADTPIPAGKTVCTTTSAYNGASQVVAATDAAGATTWTAYDGAGRQTEVWVPRSVGVYERSAKEYDADSNVITQCSPRQFDKESSTGCTAGSHYATHVTYDGLNRPVTQTAYREQAGPAEDLGPSPTWQALVTTTAYNTQARTTTTWDPNAHTPGGTPITGRGVTTTRDVLARKTRTAAPRSATETIEHTWAYDLAGNTTLAAVGAQGAPVTDRTVYSYDADNRLVDTVTAATSDLAAEATDNAYLSKAASAPADLRARTYYDQDSRPVATLDARGFTASVTSPDTRYLVRTQRDGNGRPTGRWAPLWDTANAQPLDATGGPERAQCPAPTGARQPSTITGVPMWPAGVGVCLQQAGYDNGGRLTSVTPATGVAAQATTYTWTDDNLLGTVTVPNPAGTGTTIAKSLSYDGAGRQTRDFDPNGNATGSATQPGYETLTTWTLDGLKATQRSQQPGGTALHDESWDYDPNGQPTGHTVSISPGSSETSASTYFADGKPRTKKSPAASTNAWAYDPTGNPTKVWSPSAIATEPNNSSGAPTLNTFTWDNLLASASQPVAADGSTARYTTYGYRPDGAKTSQHTDEVSSASPANVLRAGGTQTFTWSANQWPLNDIGRGGEQVQRAYDPTGQVTAATDTASGTTTNVTRLLNDAPKTFTTTVAGTAKTTGWSWQADGQPDHLKTGSADLATVDSTQAWGYNDARVNTGASSSGWGGSSVWATAYDADRRPVTMSDPDGRTTSWAWQADSLLLSKTLKAGSAAVDSWAYGSYDMAGRPLSETRVDPAGASVTHSWTWTGDGQVGSVDGAPVSWDRDGNRTGYKGGHTDYQADDAIRPSSTVAYDAVGNQTKNPCGTAVYDGLDRTITSVNNGDQAAKCGTAQTETVGYDGLGRQTTVSSTTKRSDTYRYADTSQTVLTDDTKTDDTNSPATTARYLQGPTGQALAAVDGNGARQTLETDLQGSTVLTLGGALPAVCKARFDPWGDPEDPATPGGVCQTSGSTANGRWYRQQQRDPATGNYQNGARTYNPATATWLTPDNYKTDGNPTSDLSVGTDPLTQNRYAYVNGNPINLQDPDGHFSIGNYCKWCEKAYNASNDWARDRFHDGVDMAKAGAEEVKDDAVAAADVVADKASAVKDAVVAEVKSEVKAVTQTAKTVGRAAQTAAHGVATGVQYCLGRGARTCAAVAGAVALAATGVGLLVEGGALAGLLATTVTVANLAGGGFSLASFAHTGNPLDLASAALFFAGPATNLVRGLGETSATLNGARSAAEGGARGLSDLGGVIEQTGTNGAGGRIFTSTGMINQNDFAGIVNSGLMRGEDVSILTGAHGAADGSLVADPSMLADDLGKFGGMPGVSVHNVPSMSPAAIRAVLKGPGTIIGGFCDSGACLAPFTP